jgi:exopolyphosphatase/guanosine-5'-triphosphate,3'-diphosphate pyrophosphatase
VLILDIGGGSTEFILGENRRSLFRHSYKLGTVRTLEKHPIPDPPTSASLAAYRGHLDTFLAEQVEPQLGPTLGTLSKRPVLVGTGGTASILSRVHLATDAFERDAIEAVRLNPSELSAHLERLWMLPLEERRKVPGIPPERADVILPGIAILEAILRQFGLPEFQVSTRGLRFAALKP